jgi:hypothetical protein
MRNIRCLLAASLLLSASAASAQQYREEQAQAAEKSAAEYNQRMDEYAREAAEGYRDKCLNYADAATCDKLIQKQDPAGSSQASADQPVPLSPSQVVEKAVSANQQIADRMANIDLPSAALVADADHATRVIADVEANIQRIAADINGPRPSYSGVDQMTTLMNTASAAAEKVASKRRSLAEGTYEVLLAHLVDANSTDAMEADAAMDVAIANMQRALVETRKEAYSVGIRLISDNNQELGYGDLRPWAYDSNVSNYKKNWDQLKARVAAPDSAGSQDYMRRLDDMSVFSWQASS